MAFAPSPTDGPLDDEERALLDSFYQGIVPRQGGQALDRVENLPAKPEAPDNESKAIVPPCGAAPVQAASEPAEIETEADAGDDPFAALKSGVGNRSTIDLPGPRASYRVEETSSGNFIVEHLASGEEVRVSGVDYLRFSDLQLHSEFVTRTNPPTASEAVVEAVSEPEPDPVPPIEAPAPENSVFIPGDLPDEEPSPVVAGTLSPEADHGSAFTAAEDGSITFSASDLLGGTSGPDGGGMRVLAVACGGNGTLVDNGDDSWTFTPDQAFDGSVELQVTIADGQGGIETAMATIEITPAPDNPVAGDQSPAACDDAVMAAGSVVKSTDDGGTMTYSLVSGPAEGSVSLHADGSYSFDPGSDFEDLGVGEFRDVSFIYHATDGLGGSDSGIVTITVTGSEEGPVASERSLVAPESNPIATSQTDPKSEPTDNGGTTTDGGGDRIATDVDAQGTGPLDDRADRNAVQDNLSNCAADDGQKDRNLAETPDGALPDDIPGQRSFGGETDNKPPQIDASNKGMSSAATSGMSIGSGDNPSREDRVAIPQRELSVRADPASPSPVSDRQGVSHSAAPIQPQRQEPPLDDGPEERSIQTGQDNKAPESGPGDARVDNAKPNDTIDLSAARNWTVTYANGDSFTANDTLDASLFTDTAGMIDFGNGDQVSFDNVRRFTW